MKVYISSTYQDLIEYRAAVDRTLRRMGHDVIGMEQYVAEGSKPVERCKTDVRTVDVFVIIVAWRYGYVNSSVDAPLMPRSITEIELSEAKEKGKPVLAFLLDPEAPWPPSKIDAMRGEPGSGENILRLRAELGSEYLAGIFRTPDDLASQVAAAVSAQGLTRRMVDRVLGETSIADMGAFARGEQGVNDSSLISIKDMIEGAGAARALVLQIDGGKRWWSTRLFLLASLLRSLTTVRQLVFRDVTGRFAGMASPDAIMDGLASASPLLEHAAPQLRKVASLDIERETERQIDVWQRIFTGPLPPGMPVQEPPVQPDELSVKEGVSPWLLQKWLGERWISRCIQVDSGDLSMSQVQQIVDSILPDVPVQRSRGKEMEGFELLVVDRDAFALELAREWVRSGLPRNPVR